MPRDEPARLALRPTRVEIVALLAERALARVRAAAPCEWTVTAARAVEGRGGLLALLDRGTIDLVIIDPADPRLTRRECMLRDLFREQRALRVVLYTALTSAGIKASAALLRTGRCEFLLAGIDDQRTAIRALLERLAGDIVCDLVLEQVHGALMTMPERVRAAVYTLFAAPHRFRSVEDLAAAAAITRRHLARVVNAAGLRGARQLIVVAQVIRAHRMLEAERTSLAAAARRLRLDPRILSRHIRLVVRCGSATALWQLPVSAIVRSCVTILARPDAAAR